MYQSQTTGLYECRSFDCPPGILLLKQLEEQKRRHLREELYKLKLCRFTLGEIMLIQNPVLHSEQLEKILKDYLNDSN